MSYFWSILITLCAAMLAIARGIFIKPSSKMTTTTPVKPTYSPPQATTTAKVTVTTTFSTTLLWGTPKDAYHSTRVLCDEAGLTYEQKNILCACIYQESEFLTSPRPNVNKDPKTGQAWSTDYGIVQVNDYYHIGVGKDFPSVPYVLDNPEACVRWMIDIYKSTGALTPWASYTSGAYRQWLVENSPLWDLAKV